MKNKRLKLYFALLPFTFLIHNIEEAIAIKLINNPVFSGHISSFEQFVIAITLFSMLGFFITFGREIFASEQKHLIVTTGFAGMLFLNSFFPHILSALILLRYTPGVITTAVLILPLTILILKEARQYFLMKKLASIVLIGGGVGLCLVFLFLGIGYLVTTIV